MTGCGEAGNGLSKGGKGHGGDCIVSSLPDSKSGNGLCKGGKGHSGDCIVSSLHGSND